LSKWLGKQKILTQANASKANTDENLVATHVTPLTFMVPVSGALQEMFQAVRELSVAAFCEASPQEKPMSGVCKKYSQRLKGTWCNELFS
jgi:hypothetical protein